VATPQLAAHAAAALFDALDTDGDGAVTLAEFRGGLHRAPAAGARSRPDQLVQQGDRDGGDGDAPPAAPSPREAALAAAASVLGRSGRHVARSPRLGCGRPSPPVRAGRHLEPPTPRPSRASRHPHPHHPHRLSAAWDRAGLPRTDSREAPAAALSRALVVLACAGRAPAEARAVSACALASLIRQPSRGNATVLAKSLGARGLVQGSSRFRRGAGGASGGGGGGACCGCGSSGQGDHGTPGRRGARPPRDAAAGRGSGHPAGKRAPAGGGAGAGGAKPMGRPSRRAAPAAPADAPAAAKAAKAGSMAGSILCMGNTILTIITFYLSLRKIL
jgi:hypothetical protein